MSRTGPGPSLVPVRLRRRRRPRRILPWLLGTLGLLVLIGGLTLVPAFAARDRLEEARAAMVDGQAALTGGRIGEAREAFSTAESAFVRARGHVRNPLMRVVSVLPVLGRTPDAVEAMADAGALLARAAAATTSALERLPGGLGDLAPQGGTIPLQPLGLIAPNLEEARDLTSRASEVMEGAPGSWLLGPVADAMAELDVQLDRARRVLHAAAALSEELPAFLGAEGPRRYFFGAQNPAELRGTGGLIGAYTTLRAHEGRLRFGSFLPVQELENLDAARIEPPNPGYAERYDRFGGAGFWLNINATPDFPSASVAIERLYEAVRGGRLDGVVVADPFALEALLEVTGPVEVSRGGMRITAGNAVNLLTNEAYTELRDPAARKQLLGDAARAVFRRFLAEGTATDPVGAASALIAAATDGHLLMHSVEPDVQRAFELSGTAGVLDNPSGDFLAVSGINAAGNKADFYSERSIQYRVQLGAEGSATAGTTVRLTNGAPSEGQPAYVIGPFDETFEPGENVTYLSTFCAEGCRLESFRRDGAPAEVGSEEELGHPVFPALVRLPSGGSEVLEYEWTVADAWEGDEGAGRYSLTFQGQTTIRPTRLAVDIRAPEGMSIVSTSPGMDVMGSRAVWEGEAAPTMRFDVAFERPALERAWRAIVRFLHRPLIRL